MTTSAHCRRLCNGSGGRVETYCPDWGDTCHVGEAGLILGCDAGPREIECATQEFRMACVGTVAAWCTSTGVVHYVDCQDLGFTACQDEGGVPSCTP